MAKNNPNGANQFQPDPRQALFLSYYLDPKSKTFSNAYQSAIKAGYAQEYAENITSMMPKWLSENIGDDYLVRTAEGNLKEFLEMDTTQPIVTMIGVMKDKDGKIITKENPNLKKIKSDMTKFTLERLNKKKYSPKVEVDAEFNGTVNLNANPDALKTLLKTYAIVSKNK